MEIDKKTDENYRVRKSTPLTINLLTLLRFLEIRIPRYGSFKAPEEASKLSYFNFHVHVSEQAVYLVSMLTILGNLQEHISS